MSLVSGRKAASKLLDLCQNSHSVADYADDFCMLAAESALNPESLFDTFLHRLSEEVKDELADRELPVDLDSLIALTIKINGSLRECRSERSRLGHTRTPAMARSSSRESGSFRSQERIPRGFKATRGLS